MLAGLIALAQAQSATPLQFVIPAPPAPAPVPPKPISTGRAKFEPATGCYLGVYVDLDHSIRETFTDETGKVRRLPNLFEKRVGKRHAMLFFYLGYGRPLPMDWVRHLAAEDRYVHIALEPNRGLDQVQDNAYLQGLADDMRESGAKIFLRFASEMNGPWVAYHGNPRLYREKFRLVARVMRERAPNVAMVWGVYATPIAPIPSYYPGDDAVDWVAVNIYNVTYFNQDRRTPGYHVTATDKLDYIYRRYSARKPIMVAEYGTTHFSALENRNVSHFAERNIRHLYTALRTRYPRVKAINYFNTNALDLEHRQNNNYAVTDDPRALAAYRAAIAHPHFLSRPSRPRQVAAAPPQPDRILHPGFVLERVLNVRLKGTALDSASYVRFLVDGSLQNALKTTDGWDVRLDPNALPPGTRTLRAELLDAQGRLAATFELPFEVRIGEKWIRPVGGS